MGGVALFGPVTPAPIESNETIQTQQATLGDILAQKQQREQTVQDNAMKLQAQQQAVQDQQNFSRAYRDSNYDMDAALKAAPGYNVSADGMAKRTEAHQKFQQGAVTLDDGKLKNLEAHGNLLAGYIDPITRITDPDQSIQAQKRAAAYTDAYNQYSKIDPEGAKLVSPQYPGDEGLQTMLEHAMMIKGYADHGLKLKQTAREDVQTTADAARGSNAALEGAAKLWQTAQTDEDVAAINKAYPGALAVFGPKFSQTSVDKAARYLAPVGSSAAGQTATLNRALGALVENPPADAAAYQALLDDPKTPPAVKAQLEAVMPPDKYDPQKFPDVLNRSLLTPAERNKPEGGDKNITETQLKMRAAGVINTGNKAADQMTAQQAKAALNAGKDSTAAAALASTREDTRSDRSYQFNVKELDTVGKPVADLVQRIGRLQDTLVQNTPKADALVAPELLTVMAGGQGSGLRMNEAEIARIIGGRSVWETLKAKIQHLNPDGSNASSLTNEDRRQIRKLVETVSTKAYAKQQLIDQANQDLVGAANPVEHRKIVANTRKSLGAIDSQAAPQAPSPGTIKGGYRFKGGDPSKQENWVKLQ